MCNGDDSTLDHDCLRVLAVLRRGPVTTRLRERGSGDVHDVVHEIGNLPDKRTIAALEHLSANARVRYVVQVHAYDSSEYAIHWSLACGRSL